MADGNTTSIDALLADRGADGFISLREAIIATNNTTGLDTITFNIGGGGLQTITPSSFLGFITDPVILDATTQPGYSGTPLIQLDGSSATGATAGLALLTNDSTIKGFIVHSFDDEGIEIGGSGNNNIIQNNWIGIDSTGAASPNADNGLLIVSGASGNQIGGTGVNQGNVIAGNSDSGIEIRNAGTRLKAEHECGWKEGVPSIKQYAATSALEFTFSWKGMTVSESDWCNEIPACAGMTVDFDTVYRLICAMFWASNQNSFTTHAF